MALGEPACPRCGRSDWPRECHEGACHSPELDAVVARNWQQALGEASQEARRYCAEAIHWKDRAELLEGALRKMHPSVECYPDEALRLVGAATCRLCGLPADDAVHRR